jgi:hypothetical protein
MNEMTMYELLLLSINFIVTGLAAYLINPWLAAFAVLDAFIFLLYL